MQKPLVSVVTPVYNGEAYLRECIQSVIDQTYQNWEYHIHDNCSTDRTAEIAESFAKCDPRIKVHRHREFLNVMENHNRAFRQIEPTSKYCKLVHADDWLFPRCLSEMVALAESHASVGMVGSYVLCGTRVRCDGLPYAMTVLSGREVGRLNLLRDVYLFLSPSALLLRSDLVRSRAAYYKGSYFHADVEACYEVLQSSDFGFVHQVLTYVRKHDDSVTRRMATQLNNIFLANLELLVRFGPVYLDEHEYKRGMKKHLENCYRFLARRCLRSGFPATWKHYRKGLRGLAIPFGYSGFARAVAIELGLRAAGRS